MLDINTVINVILSPLGMLFFGLFMGFYLGWIFRGQPALDAQIEAEDKLRAVLDTIELKKEHDAKKV